MDSVYLRLSVTDRCNYRCLYCRPQEGGESPKEVLRVEEWVELLSHMNHALPLRKIRLTGGEPLLAPDIHLLVKALHTRFPETELCLTTNGALLARKADQLRRAGLDRINISLDAFRPQSFSTLTRGGKLDRVLQGVKAARTAGFGRIKINSVLLRTYNGPDLTELVRFGVRHGCEPRFIELMPLGEGRAIHEREFLSSREAVEILSRDMQYLGVTDNTDGDSATAVIHRFIDADQEIRVGMIAPVSHPFCSQCDRLRMDSGGTLYPCLRKLEGVNLLEPLRLGDTERLDTLIRRVIPSKLPPGESWPRRRMHAIGG